MKSLKRTHSEFVSEVSEKTNNEYSVIGAFINMSTKVKIKHHICEHEYYVRASSFINDNVRCPECAKKARYRNRTKSHEQFVLDVYELYGSEYSIINTYTTSRDTIRLRHNVCGHIWNPQANSILQKNSHCPNCSNKKTHDMFIKEVFDLVGDEYSVLTKYVVSKEHVLMRHNVCGHQWDIKPSAFLWKNRCPKCHRSAGETLISKFLDDNDIQYEIQKRFTNCKDKHTLPFDFYLPVNNLLIEYDGQQHYLPTSFKSNESNLTRITNLIDRMIKDNIKDAFCEINNVALLRIPYWQINDIAETLNNSINL